MTHVALTAVVQRSWNANEGDPRYVKFRSIVWTMDSLGQAVMGPYICIHAPTRRLHDPVSNEEIVASPDSIPFTPMSVIDNMLEVHARGERRKMVDKDLSGE